MPDPPSVPPAQPTLRRELGLWRIALSGVGVILGAGVYALVGPAAAEAGSALWLAFLVAGVAAALTAYSYARFATMRPKNSAEFQYTSLAFGQGTGFVAGMLVMSADLLGAAAVALAFGAYLDYLTGVPLLIGALALLAVLAAVLFAGISESVGIAIVLTIIEAAGLLFIIGIGLPSVGETDYLDLPRGTGGVWSAAALIFFAYLGFDELGNFAEEMRNPVRDLPRALFIALSITTVIYLLVAFSAIGEVGWQALSESDAPLATVAEKALGSSASSALSLMALAATANTVLLLLLSASRSAYGMASSGVLPGALARVGWRRTPYIATGAALVICALLVLVEDISDVARMTTAAVLLSFILVNAGLVWMSWRGRTSAKGISRTRDLLLAGLALPVCGWILWYTGVQSIVVAAAIGLAAAVLGWWWRSRPR